MKFNDLSTLIKDSLLKHGFNQCHIYSDGRKNVCDGHLSDISFISVKCKTNGGKETILQLAIKKGKEVEEIRKAFNLKNIFKQEITLYSTIFPAFLKFQEDRNIKKIFNPLPKCYKVILTDTTELLILENLKGSRFELCDRRKPLSQRHLKVVLENIGKLHALSFAFRDQEPKLYEQITENLTDVIKTHIRGGMYTLMPKIYEQTSKLLLKREEHELFKRFNNVLSKQYLLEKVLDLINENTGYSILNHGDGWINNLMFKEKSKTEPPQLAIIDWQLVVAQNSPVYDLSFILYTCGAVEDLENLKQLLDIYYETLSSFSKQLGSNLDKLFSYETFLNHWRRYSIFGFSLIPLMMKLLYCRNEDIKTDEATNVGEFTSWVVETEIDDIEYEDRIIGTCRTFLYDNI